MNIRWTYVLIASLFALTALSGVTRADDKDDLAALKERFKQRYPQIKKAKDAKTIGETWPGYVAAVRAESLKDAKIKTLVEQENADRKKLYEIFARQHGTTVDRIGRRNAVRAFRNADAEHMLRLKDDTWVAKKDYKPDKDDDADKD